MATFPIKRTPDQRTYATVTVTSAADGYSDVIDCGGLAIHAIETSTAWTAAGIQFWGSQRSSGSLYQVYTYATTASQFGGSTSPAAISSDLINTSTAQIIVVQPELLPFRFIRLRSGASSHGGTATVQATTRILYLYLGVPEGPIK